MPSNLLNILELKLCARQTKPPFSFAYFYSGSVQ